MLGSALKKDDKIWIDLEPFSVVLTALGGIRLRLEVVGGPDDGFVDEVDYQINQVAGVVLLTWRETNGSCIVHAIDPDAGTTRAFVAAADGRFLHMIGAISATTAAG